MKLLKITTVYDQYWHSFYASHPGLNKQSYKYQKSILDYDGFGWANFWQLALEKIGYEVSEIIANIEPLQKKWAGENNYTWHNNAWMLSIAANQIIDFQPNILFLENAYLFSDSWIREIKSACPSIRRVISWCGAPYPNDDIFKSHDLVLSCIPEVVEKLKSLGHRSEHLNHAFEPSILERITLTTEPEVDFSFIGQIVRSNYYHLEREKIIEQIVQNLPIHIYSPSADVTRKEYLKTFILGMSYDGIQLIQKFGVPKDWLTRLPKIGKFVTQGDRPLAPVSPILKPYLKSPVFGLAMFQTLRNSKVTFNSHINFSPKSASNMRLFEATGVGTCLITDWKENLSHLFEPDYEVVTYRSVEECIEKVKWLLDNTEKCRAIAQSGQRRTLRYHTFLNRSKQLDEILKCELKREL